MIEELPAATGSEFSDDPVATYQEIMALDLMRRRFPMQLNGS